MTSSPNCSPSNLRTSPEPCPAISRTGELLIFLAVIAGAGCRDDGSALRMDGQGTRRTSRPARRPRFHSQFGLVPRRDRGVASLRTPGSPPTAAPRPPRTSSSMGRPVPKGSALLLMLASANRDERHFENPDPLRHPPQTGWAPHVRARRPLLPRRPAGPLGGPHRAGGGAEAIPEVGHRYRQGTPITHLDCPRLGQHARGSRLTVQSYSKGVTFGL